MRSVLVGDVDCFTLRVNNPLSVRKEGRKTCLHSSHALRLTRWQRLNPKRGWKIRPNSDQESGSVWSKIIQVGIRILRRDLRRLTPSGGHFRDNSVSRTFFHEVHTIPVRMECSPFLISIIAKLDYSCN